MTVLVLLFAFSPFAGPMFHVRSFQGMRWFSRDVFVKVSSRLFNDVDFVHAYVIKYNVEVWYRQGISLSANYEL